MAAASRQFQVFAKPVGALCNLECRYCYYLERADLHALGGAPRMPDDLLERYIAQHLDAAPGPVVTFSWHGGEPTVAGLDYFRRIVQLQRRHRPPGRRVVNGIQTNGLLLDEAWCRFFAAEGFRVGLSLDGPAAIHDRYRVTRGQEGTWARVMRAFEMLARHRVATDILCVVHDGNVWRPLDTYRFFRRIGVRSLSLLPLVERVPGTAAEVTSRSVAPEAYGAFLCAVFDQWASRDRARIAVQLFDEATRPARGLEHSLCLFRETCGDVPVVERDGAFYACDHFADSAHRIGNICDTSLGELVESAAQRAFGDAKRDRLPRFCQRCDVLAACNGGCPKDRFARAPDGELGLNYLCPAFKRFFAHIGPFAEALAAEGPRPLTLDQALAAIGEAGAARRGPARIGGMAAAPARARAADARMAAEGVPDRNDPCPCGSGRKYKKCCMASGGRRHAPGAGGSG